MRTHAKAVATSPAQETDDCLETKPLLLPLVYFNPSRLGIKTTDLVSVVLPRSMSASFPLI